MKQSKFNYGVFAEKKKKRIIQNLADQIQNQRNTLINAYESLIDALGKNCKDIVGSDGRKYDIRQTFSFISTAKGTVEIMEDLFYSLAEMSFDEYLDKEQEKLVMKEQEVRKQNVKRFVEIINELKEISEAKS